MASRAESHQHQLQQQQPQEPLQQQLQQSQQSRLQYSQATPDQQQSGESKPRSYSIHSQKTHNSSGSKNDSHETHEEKEAKRLHSKADPTLAMNEAEPSMVAAMKTNTNKVSLRSIQHRDSWGNPIADPDKSNPTRNRWERPLDTIRGFEAAIDGGYRRKSLYRAETDSVVNWNKRSSFHPANQPRFPQESYYGSRPVSFRGDGQYGSISSGNARNSMYDAQGGYERGYERGYGGGRHMIRQRMHSESNYQVYGREQGVYPMPYKDRSYETVTSAAPSGNSDPTGYQTDPTSSDNSSIDKVAPLKRREPANDYGIGFNQAQSYDAPNFSVNNPANSQPLPLPPLAPAPPAKVASQAPTAPSLPRKGSVLRRQPAQQTENNDKRKSWFSRRFSKNG